MAFSLILQNQSYSAQQLLLPGAVKASLPYEIEALNFIRQWLMGQQYFEVQTSGSTGKPKPILISRARMQASAALTIQALGINRGEAALLCIHPQYIGGKMMLVRAMEAGLPLYLTAPSANPLKMLSLQYGVPVFAALVPLQLQAILQDQESLSTLNSMKAVIVGGAAVSAALEEEAQQVHAQLYSTYGMTETVSHIALRQLNGAGRQDYFKVLPQIEISTDSRGCLVIEGPVAGQPVVTNDVVDILAPDRFRWIGRADNIVNSGGVNIQAERVEAIAEACLLEVGISRRLLAGGVPDLALGHKLVLLIEGAPLQESVCQNVLGAVSQKLPRYWTPKDILFLKKFVDSDNGKIKRKETWNIFSA